MSRYIPMPAYPDMMPVDISFVFEDEKPAGKHGFIRADGEDLRFEDGSLARFWGVNVNGGACFPDKDYAPKCARRLAQAGCNIIRFHQLDAEWDTPNLFGFTKGKRVTTTRQLDPRSLDALDYFIHCLKEEGIYVYLDMMTYRKFKEGDDVPQHELLNDSAKPWSIINARLIELQKEFCTQIWTHVNPYTGLRYCDDPAIVLTEITNECDMFLNRAGVEKATYYAQEFQSMYKAWLEQHRTLWYTPENKNAKIFICTHTDFEPVVRNKVYEVVDVRKFGDKEKGVPGPFYSELLHMYKISKRKNLPKYIGFVQYRKYFSFLDNLPDIAAVIEKHGMITPAPVDLRMPMRDQWATWGNVEDLDIATEIVNEKYPEFAKAWNANLQKTSMHPGSLHVMKTDDWKEMVAVAWDVTNEYLKRIGGDIDKRIEANPEKYHIGQYEFTDQPNERRVGGNICERIVSAWADWKYPNAAQYKLVITAEKIAPNFER
mgnify:CR=1 FL=1